MFTFHTSPTNNQLNKQSILTATNGGLDVFRHYIADFKEERKPFKAAFREDKHPSANVFRSESGEYLYKDFAEGKPMNAVDFVMKLHTCSFNEALQRINQDLNLNLIATANNGTFEEGGSTEYWNQFETSSTTIGKIALILSKYEAAGVKSYTTDKGFKVVATQTNPAFAFKLGEGYTKIYRPLEPIRKYKHHYIGKKPIDYHNIYGIAQLPEFCKTILIVEGLKDCIVANTNLNEQDIYAVGLDNVSTIVRPEILSQLRLQCDNLILCLDTDDIGLRMSESKSKQYGLRNFILPSLLNENGGKDISDWFKLKLDKQLLLDTLEEVLASPEPKPSSLVETKAAKTLIELLLATEQQVAQFAQQSIISDPPLISMGEVPIIRRGTINIIQGKYGSHKSRLAEMFCSFLIANSTNCLQYYLNFDKTDEAITVVYVDTERNLKEEFPTAIQSIKQKGCFGLTDNPVDFRFTSIKQISRNKRLDAVKSFIEEVRSQTNYPMFVLLDVVTDCVANFNDPVESMKLFDYLGNLCENYEVTFMLIIHQNPGGEKARGHTGTEAANKASTVMQIGFERGRNNEDTELIALKFLKIRSAKRPAPIHLLYDASQKGLVLAHEDFVNRITTERRQVADIELVTEELGKLLRPSLNQKDLLQQLKPTFDCSENTLKSRLEEIAIQQIEIINERGHPCTLKIKTANGKATVYELQEIKFLLPLPYESDDIRIEYSNL